MVYTHKGKALDKGEVDKQAKFSLKLAGQQWQGTGNFESMVFR